MNSLSLTGKKWVHKKFNNENITFIKENFLLDEITSKLIAIRNIEYKDIKNYIDPSIKNTLPNPENLKDMLKSVERTYETVLKNEKIGILGDYDVDGATSTAILGKYFKEIGIEYEFYIPDRKKEGYGPSVNGFKNLMSKGVKLIYTVDCGTLSFEPIEFAKKNNIDVIVIDHHQSEVLLPKAFSIINPNRYDDTSEMNYLCAAGVCFMFLISLNKKLREDNWFRNKNISEPNLLKFLDLVSLGTICDVVPLKNLNRAFVKQGLKILTQKKNLGLKTLINICEIDSALSTYHLGYVLGPRINAGGRVGKSSHGANLLLNYNPKETFKIAQELNHFNMERRELEKSLVDDIEDKVKNVINDPVIILSGKNWHEGIIGIVASRIKEKYNKPTIIISLNKNIGKASARSISGFDIGSLIISCLQNKIIEKGGGHKMAGGFTININKLNDFKEFVFKRFQKIDINKISKNIIYIDSEIAPTAINYEFFKKINILSPFGSGNPEPKFVINNVKPLKSYIVGKKHIKSILIGSDGSTLQSIAFNMADSEISPYLLENKRFLLNIVGKLTLNEWKGQKNVEFIIDDISVNKNN